MSRTPPPPADPDESDSNPKLPCPLSRRRFFTTAGQLGGALLVAGPTLGQILKGTPAAASEADLARGILKPRAFEGPVPESLFSGMRWRLLGPFRSGRTDAASGVPGRPSEFYFGAVNGGVWKTADSGRTWRPVFDDQPVASIGALAVAPSAPDTVYVGSGESTLRDSTGYGNGVYKTTDGGETWTHLGLEDTRHIGRVAVHPTDPDTVYVAAIGHFYGPNPERGVFRSRDGGRTWDKVLYKGENVGAVEVVVDPTNPEVVYAGLWNTRRPPWFVYAPTNGPGGGIYKSTDGGDTWAELTNGLPVDGMGRSGIAVCPSEPNRLYAVIDNLKPPPGETAPEPASPYGRNASGQGGFFRSDDGGESWTKLTDDSGLWGRGWYFEHVVVDPNDADTVYVSNILLIRSRDGGHSWEVIRGSFGGDDYHQAWVSPDDSSVMVTSSDQGCCVSENVTEDDPLDITWSSWFNQPIAQIYHVSVDYRFPYWVTGAQQDTGAVAVRSRGKFGEIRTNDWEPIAAGGESGCTAGDPLHPGIIYGGMGTRYDLEQARTVPGTTSPESPEPARTDWTQPLVLSQADPRALYYANQFLFKSIDGARSWTRISDDLTRPNPGVPPNLDEAAANQTAGNGRRGVIYTVAPSPLLVPMVWIGTDDGLIKVTTDDGRTWTDVTPPELTPWARVTTIEASHHDFNTAYASVDRHQLEDFTPYIYRTRDRGRSWERITTGMPDEGYVHVVREDPERPGLLVAGTERGVFVSFDDGEHWQSLQLNLPVTSMRDFQIYAGDLIVATHGRGFWVMDDISPLRQADPALTRSAAHLYQPADATLVDQGGDNGMPLEPDEPQTPNPPTGAYIDYWLAQDAGNAVTLEILDAHGTVLESWSPGSPQEGPGRGMGGRGGGQADQIPGASPHWINPPEGFGTGPGMHRQVWTPFTGGRRGYGRGPQRPVVTLPGTFTARLTVRGESQERTFMVHPDPRPLGEE